ncbi:TetR/AcrR family transcriptional regulator [Actinomyces israelii]|uniref:TetR/AcrR family transcriptional regulator n=1 Tax=Actinomyces israelii TaxID=1659 RepID=A0ABT4I8A4_9ACTO|nr:TetR/AcrR family transcriptional regulator [Actinomyces israelii]MCZ0857569.1 TetR/AcrR family transcriptional regulator [Actinomyces israelii]WKR22961.1 hypothetical protein AIF0345_2924 [Actinomyces israelii]
MPKIMGSSLAEHRERTRTALFDALSELMAKRSFDKITLSDVASHAGVGRTAVYNHFADKEDLLLAFMEHETARYAEELSAALAGVEDPIDRLRVYVRQQALIKRHFHFPSSGPLANSVSRGTAGRLRAHAGLMAQMLAQILTDAVATGAIPPQDPAQVIPLVHACVMGGRPTPTEPAARAAYLDALDTFVLRAVGAPVPEHGVPAVPPTHATQDMSDEAQAEISVPSVPSVRAVAG